MDTCKVLLRKDWRNLGELGIRARLVKRQLHDDHVDHGAGRSARDDRAENDTEADEAPHPQDRARSESLQWTGGRPVRLGGGGGTFWKLVKGSAAVTILATLADNSGGIGLSQIAAVGPNGEVYGTTYSGGDSGADSVWEFQTEGRPAITTPEPSSAKTLLVVAPLTIIAAATARWRRESAPG
jgi:hypothetical protein